MPGSKLESLGSLQRLNAALTAKAEEMPQLEASRVIFETKVAQVEDLVQEQAELTAGKQDVTRRFQQALADAQRMSTAMRAALKVHFGPGSEKLVEFGIQPFRGKTRKPSPPEPPPVAATAEQ